MGSGIEPPSGSTGGGDPQQIAPSSTTPPSVPSHAGPPQSIDERTVVSRGQPVPAPAASGMAGGPLQLSSLLEGELLGHFKIDRYVGGGGMGAVFRAQDTLLNRPVAVKVLAGDQASDPETLARFRNEGQAAARLDHDNIARVYHIGEDRGLRFIVFEYVEGINIRDLIAQNGRLSVEDAVSFTLQIAEALAHASSREIVHRDVKPSNVLILHDGRVKLVDMGLARQFRTGKTDEDLTASGVTLGTFDYISPEQARDPRNADVRSDIYSLGCTIYYMLTSQPPFPEGTVLQKLLQHQGDEPPDPRDHNPAVPDEIARIVRKMLAKNPRERYQNPAELVGELLLAAQHLGLRGPGTTGVVWMSPNDDSTSWLERHVPWVVPATALVLIVLVLEFFVWAPDDTALENVSLPSAPNASVITAPDAASADGQAGDGETNVSAPANVETDVGPGSSIPTARNVPPGASRDNATVPRITIERLSDARATVTLAVADTEVGDPAGAIARPELLSAGTSVAAADVRNTSIAVPSDTAPGDTVVPVQPASPEPGLLIVDSAASGPRTFRSLEAAATAAKSGDTIELRYSGRRGEKPVTFHNTDVTIRAGAGFEPIIAFRPGSQSSDPLQQSRGMIGVVGGGLTLEGLTLEMDLPREAAGDNWSLVELQNTELVKFSKCTLTIRNAAAGRASYLQGVSFFNVTAPPGQDSIIMPEEMIPHEPDVIELNHCIVRGEATVLRSADLQPVALTWNNGLLATSDSLLRLQGDTMPPRGDHGIQIELNHLTASALGGLCAFDDSRGTFLVSTEIRAANSIIQVPAGAAMIDWVWSGTFEEIKKLLDWSGHHNVYAAAQLWRLAPSGNSAAEAEVWEFTDWNAFWQNRDRMSIEGPIAWKSVPTAEKKMHAHTPADYQLDVSEIFNPAVHYASNGRDAGMITEQLPQLSAPVASSPSVEQ